jgi:2-polyprenyl-6-methoxyphenol hydroxylase-like FAD-dependent oxidoreductase
MAASTNAILQRKLLDLHGGWAQLIPHLIEKTEDILSLVIHDVPSLPRWSAGRVILLGDAAHAVAPHSGQGASMALKDSMYLAKLLRDEGNNDLQTVFAHFEKTRRPRTDRVIALGRRNAQRKEKMSPFAYWLQQQMTRILIPLSGKKDQDWLLGYKADW